MTLSQAILTPVFLLPPFLAVFFVLRLAPVWHERNQGCDAYYFLLCAEEFRKRLRLPIVLPGYYRLEAQEQYYPPGFSVFCALFPPRWLDRYHWLLNHILDAILFSVLVVWIGAHYGLALAWIAGLIYAGGPLVMEYRGLTSRPLGVLLFTTFLVATRFSVGGSIAGFAVALLAGVLLLYTHKLSVQLLWFMVPVIAIAEQEPAWLWPLLAAYALAFALGRGYFVNILRAHVDIVTFWRRNWRLLGAHMVRQSPVYGDGLVDTSYHAGTGVRSALGYAVSIVRHNYFVVMTPLALLDYPALSDWERFFLLWVFGACAWAFLTLYVPWLRLLGLGILYVKYAHLPALALTAGVLTRAETPWPWLLAALCLVYNIRYYANTSRDLRRAGWQSTGAFSGGFEAMVERIKGLDDPRILCIPTHIADSVAYHTRKPVLWGTHGYGFRMAEPIFPVLRITLADIVRDMGATHLLLDRRYAAPSELCLDPADAVVEAEDYILIPLNGALADGLQGA